MALADEYVEPVPTVFCEERFAGHKTHQCGYCSRWIDQRPYTRTAIADHTGHKRSFSVTIVCEDCQTVRSYAA